MTKENIEKIKKIKRIEKILQEHKLESIAKEYAELIKELDDEEKKEKLKYIIAMRQARPILPLNLLDELIATLDRDEDKLELINIADNDGIKNEANMFNKTISSLSTDERKVEVLKEDLSFYYSIGDLISSLSTDELKIELMGKLQDKMKLSDYKVIISSLSTDKLKLEQMEQKKEELGKYKEGNDKIIESLNSDEAKIYALETYRYMLESDVQNIIASLSNDKLKLEQLDKFNLAPFRLGKVIASLSSDKLKLEQLYKFQEKLYGEYARSEGFSKVISSLSNDEIKIQLFHKYENDISDKIEIIQSLETDEAKIKLIDETGYISGDIIASFTDDKNKIELIRKHVEELRGKEIAKIIKSLEVDEEKVNLFHELSGKISVTTGYGYANDNASRADLDIISNLTTDEARIKWIELCMEYSKLALLCLETDEAKLKVIELLNEEKHGSEIISKLDTFFEDKNNVIRKIVLSLNTNEKKIEALVKLQENFDEKMLREIIATLDYYDDCPEENIMFKLSSGERITVNNKTLNIPINKMIDNEDAEHFRDCYFKYFNSEIENKQNIFQNTDEEIRDFLKFAKTLGCFSKDKVLDEDGRETEVYLGQKASSLLAQLLKTDELRIRTISWTI